MMLTMMLFFVVGVAYAADAILSNLTVIINYEDTALEGVEITLCRVAEPVTQDGDVAYEATEEFSGAEVDFSDLSTDSNIALAAILDAYASANDIERTSATTNKRGGAFFDDLPDGIYLVAQKNNAHNEYDLAPYLVIVPNPDPFGRDSRYDVISYPETEPTRRDLEFVSVNVYKVWAGSNVHPTSVKVQLYCNNAAYEDPVVLDDSNYWRYTWDSLSPSDTWTVEEIDIPAGYKRAISGNPESGFIITNTKDSSTPTTPVPQGKTGGNPQTGDRSNITFWIILLVNSLAGLIALFIILNPSRSAHTPEGR